MTLLKHTYKLANGEKKTSADWYYRFTLNGKIHFGSTKTTNKALAAKVEKAKYAAALTEDELGDKPTLTTKAALDEFLTHQERSGEYRNIKTYCAKMLGTKTGRDGEVVDVYGFKAQKQFHDLADSDVQKLILARRREGNADATIILELVQLSKAIKLIGKLGYMRPTIDLAELRQENQLKPEKKPLRYLSHEEDERLAKELDPASAKNDELKAERADMRDFAIVLISTGARYSEIAKLRWVDVNLVAKTIALWRGKVKNESVLHMTDDAFATLGARHAVKRRDQVYVFENSDKTGHRKYAPKSFKNACKRAGINDISLKHLRKTFASRLVQAGLPIFTVSKLIGHASVVTTTTHYAHLAPNHGSMAAVDILNKKGG